MRDSREPKNPVLVHFDGGGRGSCSWGAVIRRPGCDPEVHGGKIPHTCTSQRAELIALAEALSLVGTAEARATGVKVIGDSTYAVYGATRWLRWWKSRGWRSKDGDPLKNSDVWKRIHAEMRRLGRPWIRWVPREMNLEADAVASAALSGKGLDNVLRVSRPAAKKTGSALLRDLPPSRRVPPGCYHVPPDFDGRPFVLVRDGVASLSPDDGGLPRISDRLLDSEPIRLLGEASSRSWPAYTMRGTERRIDAVLARYLCRNTALRDALGLSE